MAKANGEVNLREIATQERERLTARRNELQADLNKINDELASIDRYFGTPQKNVGQRKPTADNRAPRGSVRTAVLDLLAMTPTGLAPKDIIEKTGLGKQSVHNALLTLKNDGAVKNEDGRYFLL